MILPAKKAEFMQVIILFDNSVYEKGFKAGWGISYFIEGGVLFDTGEAFEPLYYNMQKVGLGIADIKKIVISHDHWDHWGGLWKILEMNNNLGVYICPNFSWQFKQRVKNKGAKIVEVKPKDEILPGIYTTGEIHAGYKSGQIYEQTLVLKGQNGLSLLTGCSHPGILEIIKRAKELFGENIYLAGGGFHLLNSEDRIIRFIARQMKKQGIKKAAPTHCSGKTAEDIFSLEYKEDFVRFGAGRKIVV